MKVSEDYVNNIEGVDFVNLFSVLTAVGALMTLIDFTV